MTFLDTLRARWGVGPWDVVAIFLAFAVTGLTIVKLRSPIIGFLLPGDAPGWVGWLVYFVVLLPLYQALLLTYGALLGQFTFFWGRLSTLGRLMRRRRGRSSLLLSVVSSVPSKMTSPEVGL